MAQLTEKKILLASGDATCCEIIIMLLKAFGYEPIWIKDYTIVLDTITKTQPDLIIVDCQLPSLDGLDVIKQLKSEHYHSHIPVLMMIDKKKLRRDILDIEEGLDDYLTKPPDPIDLEVRIEMALRRTEHQFFANPLSKLPGSRKLEKVIQEKLTNQESLSFLYCDINNFKSFNDKYGYKCGDAVIMHTAHILTRAVKKFSQNLDYVFHIGGDDFVIVTVPEREANIARLIIDEFDKLIPFHYSALDRDRGFIRIKNRLGKVSDFALMGISIAIVNNVHRKINNLIEFIEIAFEIKRYLKKHKRSRSLVNRRKKDPGLEENRLKQTKQSQQTKRLSNYKNKARLERKVDSYKPLGQILLEKNLINSEQLAVALFRHWNSNMHLGEVLQDMNIIPPTKLERILRKVKINTDSDPI